MRAEFPEDWPVMRLGDIAKIQTGLALGRQPDGDTVERPYLRVANVQDGHLDLREIKTVRVRPDQVNRFSLRPGDVLLTEGGDFDKLGRGCIWSGEISKCLHQNHVFSVRPNSEVLDPRYLAAITSSTYGKTYFLRCSKQTTNLASINSSQLRSMPIPVPSMAEQVGIVEMLSVWNAAISDTTELIRTKQELRKGLVQQLLTRRLRFPEFQGQEWQPKQLGAFLTESRVPGGSGVSAQKLTVKLYGKGVVAKSEARSGSASTRFYKRLAGQFIYSKLDFLNGAFGLIPSELDGYETTLDLPAFDVDASIVDARWLLHYVSRPSFYKRHLGLAHGGRKARRVNPKAFLKLSEPIPPIAEQSKVADLVDACDREIKLLAANLKAVQQQRKGLVQKLLSGEVRVKGAVV